MDFCCRELELNVEHAVHLNDAQAAEAIIEADMHHPNPACALQQAHMDSVLVLECKVQAEEGGISKPLQRPLGQLCKPVYLSTVGHSCTPYSSWPVMCP